MRVFIIDTSNVDPGLQGGLVGVIGRSHPSAEEKQECIDTVSRLAMDGWAISADPFTPIGWLAAVTAESACVPFVSASRLSVTGTAPPFRQLGRGWLWSGRQAQWGGLLWCTPVVSIRDEPAADAQDPGRA